MLASVERYLLSIRAGWWVPFLAGEKFLIAERSSSVGAVGVRRWYQWRAERVMRNVCEMKYARR